MKRIAVVGNAQAWRDWALNSGFRVHLARMVAIDPEGNEYRSVSRLEQVIGIEWGDMILLGGHVIDDITRVIAEINIRLSRRLDTSANKL